MTTTRKPVEALQSIPLPKPDALGEKLLFDALSRRRTIRDIDPRPLSRQTLSNLMWSAWGVNRTAGPFDTFGRTAASASNSQEIDLYVALEEGAFVYDAAHHHLLPVTAKDIRTAALNRRQKIPSLAPVRLIYVVDVNRLTHTVGFDEPGLHDPEVQKSYYYVDTGLIAGNVYLFAAATGMAAWFHNCDRETLAQELKLRPEQRVLFAQSFGWPVNEAAKWP
jgi:nitroreductase